MSVNIDKLLAVLRARGCDPRDLRDGAHEAHHAIYVNLRKPWTRDRIHEALLKLARRSRIESIGLGFNELLVKYELEARAVEWIVCERAGGEYKATTEGDPFGPRTATISEGEHVGKTVHIPTPKPWASRCGASFEVVHQTPGVRGMTSTHYCGLDTGHAGEHAIQPPKDKP